MHNGEIGMRLKRNRFQTSGSRPIGKAVPLTTLFADAANDSMFHMAMELPRGIAEHCIRDDFLALENHMKACAIENGFFFHCRALLHTSSRLLVSRIVCTTTLLVVLVMIVSAFF